MKFSKLFVSNSIVACLSLSISADASESGLNGSNYRDSDDCRELLTSQNSDSKMKLNFHPLPMRVRLEYGDEIRKLRKKLLPVNESAQDEIEKLQNERQTVRARIEVLRDEEMSLKELKAMEEVSWGVHSSWELSHMGRLPLLSKELKKLERKGEELDIEVSRRIPALKDELIRERGAAENRKSQLGKILSESIKEDLSNIVQRLSQNSLLPDGDRLLCEKQDWRIYEVRNQVSAPKVAQVEKLIDLSPPNQEILLALSLCRLDDPDELQPTYIRLGFRGFWNPSSLQLELYEMSYQRLER